jgi:GTP pyrophosphokinase
MRTLNIETKDDLFEGTIMLYVFDTKQLDKLIGELRQINNIQKVSRIS